ncbi:Protein of unknown function [Pyronema omphalodes CBS 100304]|uniref:Uncharacterized protein n=1 Tax=Pyronema omphalodes (strain CBS 100304) TaxID=1076935 RepID=U4LEW2_PYROM|nr:Protein of unknown function [Pyronema omphalodes CBS 100304]
MDGRRGWKGVPHLAILSCTLRGGGLVGKICVVVSDHISFCVGVGITDSVLVGGCCLLELDRQKAGHLTWCH